MFVNTIRSMSKKPKIDESRLDKANPFISNLSIPVRRVVKSEYKKDANGEFALKDNDIDMEYTPFARVFTTSENRMRLIPLSARSKELLFWIMYEMKSGKDWLWLNKDRYMDESGIGSYNTYHAAVCELMDHRFIARSSIRDVYFIDPSLFYKGNRIEDYPENTFIKYDDPKNMKEDDEE